MQRRQRLSKVSQFAGLSFLAFSSSRCPRASDQEKAEDNSEERVGIGRSNQGSVSLFSRSRTGGSRP
jgi:hypothetical protein